MAWESRRSAVLVVIAAFLLTAGLSQLTASSQSCSRLPEDRFGHVPPKTPGSNGFQVVVGGNQTKYFPGKTYTVKLQVVDTKKTPSQRFEGFYLVVEPATPSAFGFDRRVGRFQPFGEAMSRLSDRCSNMLTHTSEAPKSEVTVMWTAPPAGSGCVVFRATVIERRGRWYMDDDALSYQLCEQVQENLDEQPPPLMTCCACDEAKYEVTFEGLWSRHTHPKDFPRNEMDAGFSDVIGASHSARYRFWEYGGLASEGVRQLAEWGDTKKLETELKEHSDQIRTIIKARGLAYPDLQGRTFAVFRTDRQHHQASLISRIRPSPDWLVGVSAMELCLLNCSWTQRVVLNLRPWDAGTNNGVSYNSSPSSTIPHQRMQRITTKGPVDSPFHDPNSDELAPLARLTFQRQRVYTRQCHDTGAVSSSALGRTMSAQSFRRQEDDPRPQCATSTWSSWSSCSASCGQGFRFRQRFYRNPTAAKIIACRVSLNDQEACRAWTECNRMHSGPSGRGSDWSNLPQTYYYGSPDPASDPAMCELTEWSRWSPCTVTCGQGSRIRRRNFKNRLGVKFCSVDRQETQLCRGEQPECEAPEQIPDGCAVTPWSDWSPCSVTCGQGGYHVRTRDYIPDKQGSPKPGCSVTLRDQIPCEPTRLDCSVAREEAEIICREPKDVGSCRGSSERWYYDLRSGKCDILIYSGCKGNKNNFQTYEDCAETCEQAFSSSSPIQRMGEFGGLDVGSMENGRPVEFGSRDRYGRPAEKSYSTDRYSPPARNRETELYGTSEVINPLVVSASLQARSQVAGRRDCQVSEWSAWSECSATCGRGHQHRRRTILEYPRAGGRPCDTRRRHFVRNRECYRGRC